MIARYLSRRARSLISVCAFRFSNCLGWKYCCYALSRSGGALCAILVLFLCLCVKVDVFLSALRFICSNCVCFLLFTLRLAKKERKKKKKREFSWCNTKEYTMVLLVKTRYKKMRDYILHKMFKRKSLICFFLVESTTTNIHN